LALICGSSQSRATSQRRDRCPQYRWCCRERSDNTDIGWLKVDDTTGAKELPKPDEIVAMIQQRLRTALEETVALNAQLDCSE